MVRVVGFQANTATEASVKTRVAIRRVLVFMAALLRCQCVTAVSSESANQLTHRPERAAGRGHSGCLVRQGLSQRQQSPPTVHRRRSVPERHGYSPPYTGGA